MNVFFNQIDDAVDTFNSNVTSYFPLIEFVTSPFPLIGKKLAGKVFAMLFYRLSDILSMLIHLKKSSNHFQKIWEF